VDIDSMIEANKVNKSAEEVVNFFRGKVDPAKEIAAIDDELKADQPNPLDFKELCPELASELEEAQNMAKFWEERERALKDQVKRLAGKDRGLIQRGNYAFDITETKGRTSVGSADYERYIRDTMTEAGVKECREKYAKTGDPIIRVSVKKLG